MSWSERLNLDYSAKYTAPIEAVKWHDSLVNHFNKSGHPSGELSLAIVPRHVLEWFTKFPKETDVDAKSRRDKEKAEAKAALEETKRLVEAGEAGPAKRGTVPAGKYSVLVQSFPY
jgi:hypothetical protein